LVPQLALEGEAPASGDYQGITWEAVAPTRAAVCGWRDADGTIPRLRKRLVDRIRFFAGLYGATPRARRRLSERIERRECDLVFVYDRSAIRMTPLARLCRARGVPALLDVTEASEHIHNRMSPVYWDFAVGTRATPRLFDGLTVITTGLAALYRKRGCPRAIVLPSIEEWPSAPPPPPTGRAEFRLTYVGALRPRDAPELLLEAVRRVAERGAPLTLDLIGHYEGTAGGEELARRCAADPVLGRIVRFRGSASDGSLARELASSDGLVLTRRDAPTEVLSFPTRLVEYLRYGRPVLVSDVGDVSRYLRHGEDAVLLDPRDPGRAAEAIAALVHLPDRGAAIGRRGREAGRMSFDREAHAARLLEFAEALGARRAA
ncbi:MAG TPA: glycosyltransferase family 4 protein, partial [Vicinamibacteria bacterium]|nr:glycosyltransferase family 4 protein [Vicinamibacteria bacterium]